MTCDFAAYYIGRNRPIYELCTMVVSYSNEQTMNSTDLVLGVLLGIVWVGLFIYTYKKF